MLFDAKKGVRGDELQKLLAPLSPKLFLKQYWGQQAVHIRGGAAKFKGFFSKDDFWKALKHIDALGPSSPALVRAHWDDRDRPAGVTQTFERVDAAGAKKALARGATLCVNVISAGDERLRAFIAAVKQQLSWPGLARFNAYWSPDGRGLGAHFDARITCSLQIAGKKTWWFTPHAVVPWPQTNADRLENGTAEYSEPWAGHEAWELAKPTTSNDFEKVTLEPGDVLVLPAGAWHAAAADGESLALNLAMDAVRPLTILAEALDDELRADEAWRVAPPQGGVKHLRERAKALRQALQRLESDEKRLARLWKARVDGAV
jgi:ribosomal protein L16 Arg81 hydroxylase